MDRSAAPYVNWQQRAAEFSVGDVVVPFGGYDSMSGRVTAVWPAIGMIDVEFPTGSKRYPAEDLQRFDGDGNANPPTDDSVPGGQPTVSVPGGPYKQASSERVAKAHHKRSIYWASKDRKYRMTGGEHAAGCPNCPKCKDTPLKRAIYKRRDGSSDRLMGCPGCMFLIKDADIVNFGPADNAEFEVETEARVAGFSDSLLWSHIDQRDFMKLWRNIQKQDEQAAKLLKEVSDALVKALDLSSNESAALNRLSQMVGSGQNWDISLLRNNIFKAADRLGLKLPSGMF